MGKVKTQNSTERRKIKLCGNVTTYYFYNSFMQDVYEYTNKNSEATPIIDITEANWIDSNVLPCMIVIGVLLKRYYKEPTELDMVYKPSLLQYLDTADFFYWVGREKLNIYKFNEELIGGFGIYVKEYNRQYKIEKFQGISGFYDLAEPDRETLKYRLLDQLERFDIKRIFGGVFSKIVNTIGEEYDRCIQSVAEIVCNSMLYSESDSYVCVQALKDKVDISICDIGIGFEKSLLKKGIKIYKMVDSDIRLSRHVLESEIFDDYFAFFTAIYHAEETGRVNLWKLKEIITNNRGVMRIHTNRIQMIFSYRRCYNCKVNGVAECRRCLLKNFSTNYRVSPLRIYNAKIEGVHIEISFSRG
ncbi:MAG: hypothetical protein LIO79_09685 [Rikenellaceae bacterium]|nr:hypothetical protein [Rikenellaceae bacterium]